MVRKLIPKGQHLQRITAKMKILSAAIVIVVRTAFCSLLLITLLVASASAFDLADLKKLMETNKCVECDLLGADLVG